MSDRLRGAASAGGAPDGVLPGGFGSRVDPWAGLGSASPAAAMGGWFGRLGAAFRPPRRERPEPAPGAVEPGGMTVADLVSARGLGPPRRSAGDDPLVEEPGSAPEDGPVDPPAAERPPVDGSDAADVDADADAGADVDEDRDDPAEQPDDAAPDPTADAVDEPVDAPAVEPAAAGARPGAAAVVGPGVGAAAERGSVTDVEAPWEALQPPADVDLLAPPWARFPLGDSPPPEPPDDPAAATDRLRRRPRAVIAAAPALRRPAPPAAPPGAPPAGRPVTRFSVAPRPTVVDDLVITGLTRRSRSRWGSRLFMLFFALVYLVILVQLVDSLLHPTYR